MYCFLVVNFVPSTYESEKPLDLMTKSESYVDVHDVLHLIIFTVTLKIDYFNLIMIETDKFFKQCFDTRRIIYYERLFKGEFFSGVRTRIGECNWTIAFGIVSRLIRNTVIHGVSFQSYDYWYNPQ